MVFAVDDDKATLKGNAVRVEDFLECRRVGIRRACCGDRLCLAACVAGDILREFKHHAGGVFAQLRGIRRKPAVDGAVHELKAEQEHEDRGRKRDERGAEDHAGPETCAECAAALVGIELEDVTEQEKQQDKKQQKNDDGEAGKGQGFAGGFGIEKANFGGIEGLKPPSKAKKSNTPAPRKITVLRREPPSKDMRRL